MRAPIPYRPVARAAGLTALIATLAACGERMPAGMAPQPQLAESFEQTYRQLSGPETAAMDASCDTAPALAHALDGWSQAVDAAGLQARFSAEMTEARHRATAIRSRCPDTATATATAGSRAASERTRTPAADPRPAITTDMLDAYARGLDEEIALMHASGSHFVSLSKYDAQGLQVAAKAGLPLPEYRGLRQAMHKVLYELMMHARYAGPDGQARLAGLEPHKREHAEEVLARDPYASLSAAERKRVQARLAPLQAQYDGYMRLAAIAD
ncbi:hypothetical protein LDO26_02665 [Luteimonas sp. BDR2-5]|uniref:hypothetical protein n=1 Tax=Proluteimonas luteida TaxID=2878685 RepID=UPI001E34D995|nr:hypothetical protein [Luteimonas sp. BDR2-5]MCD9027116.1 hypothetical protein [Luteimonas sp. BDR2-5]